MNTIPAEVRASGGTTNLQVFTHATTVGNTRMNQPWLSPITPLQLQIQVYTRFVSESSALATNYPHVIFFVADVLTLTHRSLFPTNLGLFPQTSRPFYRSQGWKVTIGLLMTVNTG